MILASLHAWWVFYGFDRRLRSSHLHSVIYILAETGGELRSQSRSCYWRGAERICVELVIPQGLLQCWIRAEGFIERPIRLVEEGLLPICELLQPHLDERDESGGEGDLVLGTCRIDADLRLGGLLRPEDADDDRLSDQGSVRQAVPPPEMCHGGVAQPHGLLVNCPLIGRELCLAQQFGAVAFRGGGTSVEDDRLREEGAGDRRLLVPGPDGPKAACSPLLTLPVELDASFRRALPILETGRFLDAGDLPGARTVLRAAALTYVASALVSLVNIARFRRLLPF